MAEAEKTYSCPRCKQHNFTSKQVVFRANSIDNRWRPFVCRDCYPQQMREYHYPPTPQRMKEAEEAEKRKAHHQSLWRQARARSVAGEAAFPLPDTEFGTGAELPAA